MAIKTNGDRINEAIVKKVEKVLNSAERIQEVHIQIDGCIGELPMIKYSICEMISPVAEIEKEDDKKEVNNNAK